ncbi:hypothetical protein PTKIN_Ptkin02bG0094100 [Pterospermum kingtungense]
MLGFRFSEAPDYCNGVECQVSINKDKVVSSSDPSLLQLAMTLDSKYLCVSIAAIHSILCHLSCPKNIFFHFIATEFDPTSPRVLSKLQALENPLNYARNYLGDILNVCIDRVIYLNSNPVIVDDILKLWNTTLANSRVIGAPEYCHANFTKYFTNGFWFDPVVYGPYKRGKQEKTVENLENRKIESFTNKRK